MSTATKKLQRYAVTFKDRLIFNNATSPDEALARVRTDLLKEAVRRRNDWIAVHGPSPVAMNPEYPDHLTSAPEINRDLATFESFKFVTRVKLSIRY